MKRKRFTEEQIIKTSVQVRLALSSPTRFGFTYPSFRSTIVHYDIC